MTGIDRALARIGSWAWRRHGEELGRSREVESPLDRIRHEGQSAAFQEVSKYIDVVRQANGEQR